MKLFFMLAGIFIATQAHAALECVLPPDTAVIESTVLKISLSADGKELVQQVALGEPATKLVVTSNVTDNSGTTTISGNVVSLENFACPGSCGTSTFKLVISPATNGMAPNAALTKTSTRFNETTGVDDVVTGTWKYVCQ
jgi:hypothetical protein